jgi:transcriptional regulatory protein LevR
VENAPWAEGESRAMLEICAEGAGGADFLTSMLELIEGREPTDAELRAMALGVRFGVHLSREGRI